MLLPLFVQADSGNYNIWKKPKLFLQLDPYYSFVENRGANLLGAKAGLEFGKKYRFGLGYYVLKSDIIELKHLTPDQAKEAPNDTVKAQLRMKYVPICFEYIFYNKENWQVSVPVDLGFGRTYFTYFDQKGNTRRLKDHAVILTDVVVMGQYKILKWVAIGAGIGYRKMLLDNPAIDRKFDSPLYTIRVKLFLEEIYKSAFPKGIHFNKQNSNAN